MKRITLFAGHYGSGKTNIALNYARYLKNAGSRSVAMADLDIVNPYFRTKDYERILAEEGIRLVVSEYANSNVDFPAMPKEAYSLFADRSTDVVVDVGGDDRGALALGRYVQDIIAEDDYEMVGVINRYRPLTDTVEGTVEVLREIEVSAGLKITSLVNNSNLGQETAVQSVLSSMDYAQEVSAAMGVPVMMTTCPREIAEELRKRTDAEIFPLDIVSLYYFARS